MSLDLSRLEKPRIKGGKTIARCPACAETGGDNAADHLFINSDGKFGCVLYQGSEGYEHRKRIFEMVGIDDAKVDKSTWKALPSAPDNAPAPTLTHYKHGSPVAHWIYRTHDGAIAGIVARFDLPNGRKETLPLSWCRDQHGNTRWQWKALAEPRPLYGQPFDERTIVIVEGEKCTDAVRLAGFQATTWQGGSSATEKTDFAPLAGRQVIVWPDNDQPGFRAMNSITAKCQKLGCDVHVVAIPSGMPDGWDAADDPSRIADVLATAAPIEHEHEHEPVMDATTDECPRNRIPGMPFRILGMDDGIMQYMPDNGQHVVSITPGGHTKLNLLQLAPLNSWEHSYPAKNGADWDAAANALIQLSQSSPKFDPRSIRGRGCWIDGDDVVFHAGDRLAVNGQIQAIPNYSSPTSAIYESGLSIAMHNSSPALNADAAKLIELCDSLSWECPLFGRMVAGWIAMAPICGALAWRPHIWITGPAGSGKSWIMANIINPMIGKSAVFVQGNTSEAGIRGTLRSDALPVMFDEAESENNKGMARMDGVLELARQASTESGAGIIKGTQSGGSITYIVRSMFCFSSIGVAAVKKADTSRISVLSLTKNKDSEQFNRIKSLAKSTVMNAEYCAKIRARSVANAATIRANAGAFADAATTFTGDRRSADQVGTLLAGAFSLTSTKRISHDSATAWLEKQDWNPFKSDDLDSDENQCFSHLLAAQIRVDHGGKGSELLTVEEAISMVTDLETSEYHLAIRRNGIKIVENYLAIANNHPGLERIFAGTPWSGAKWKAQFLRIPGSHPAKIPVRFGDLYPFRATFIPIPV